MHSINTFVKTTISLGASVEEIRHWIEDEETRHLSFGGHHDFWITKQMRMLQGETFLGGTFCESAIYCCFSALTVLDFSFPCPEVPTTCSTAQFLLPDLPFRNLYTCQRWDTNTPHTVGLSVEIDASFVEAPIGICHGRTLEKKIWKSNWYWTSPMLASKAVELQWFHSDLAADHWFLLISNIRTSNRAL